MCMYSREITPKYNRNADFFAVFDLFMTAVAMATTANSQNTHQ